MSSTKWNSELKQLFHETKIRYPHQQLEPETIKAYLQDWRELCEQVGFARFSDAVKRARSYHTFFPLIAQIGPLVPDPPLEGERKGLADEDCPICDGTSWERVSGQRDPAVRRCKCWLKNRARLSA